MSKTKSLSSRNICSKGNIQTINTNTESDRSLRGRQEKDALFTNADNGGSSQCGDILTALKGVIV